jgi:hypothetical protein
MRDQQNSENRLGAGGGCMGRIGTVGDRGRSSDRLPRLLGRVAEWQTRWLQVPVSFGTWGFKSPFAHNEQSCDLADRGYVRTDPLVSGSSAVLTMLTAISTANIAPIAQLPHADCRTPDTVGGNAPPMMLPKLKASPAAV